MPKKQINIYQSYIIQLYRKTTQKKQIFILPKDGQKLPKRLFKEVNSNIYIFGHCSTYNKANNQIFRKMETKIFSKRHYKVCSVK